MANTTAVPELVEAPTVTVPCELENHGRCRGVVQSLLVEPGTRCGCGCHDGGRS